MVIKKSYVETRRDDTALVDAADQVDDDLAGTVIVDDLEVTEVAGGRIPNSF